MDDKHEVYRQLKNLGASPVMAKKHAMSNIVFPKFGELGLYGDAFRQCVKTHEAPDGHIYDENEYRVVWRICNGKLYSEDGFLDIYAWSDEDFKEKATKAVPVGSGSPVGLVNLTDVINSVEKYEDKIRVANEFHRLNMDLLLVHSKEEIRSVVEITETLYKAGITSCIDKWCKEGPDGHFAKTSLEIGDFLVLDHDNEMVYCIKEEPFKATHTILWK